MDVDNKANSFNTSTHKPPYIPAPMNRPNLPLDYNEEIGRRINSAEVVEVIETSQTVSTAKDINTIRVIELPNH